MLWFFVLIHYLLYYRHNYCQYEISCLTTQKSRHPLPALDSSQQKKNSLHPKNQQDPVTRY